MKFYYHPLSTYSQKALIALYEKSVEFEPRVVDLMKDQQRQQYQELYPLGKIPLLVLENDYLIPESSIIIEYLEGHFAQGPQLIPADSDEARKVRCADRMNDLYLNESVTSILFDSWKPDPQKNPDAVAKAKARLDIMYGFMETQLADNDWCNGDSFRMSDCAAAAPLFYAQNVYPFAAYGNIVAYFERLKARPSYQRVLQEAMPFLEAMKLV